MRTVDEATPRIQTVIQTGRHAQGLASTHQHGPATKQTSTIGAPSSQNVEGMHHHLETIKAVTSRFRWPRP
jgi:hypothetical protein